MFHEGNSLLDSFAFNRGPQGTLAPSGAGGGLTVQIGRSPKTFVSGGLGGVKQVANRFTKLFRTAEAARTAVPSVSPTPSTTVAPLLNRTERNRLGLAAEEFGGD